MPLTFAFELNLARTTGLLLILSECWAISWAIHSQKDLPWLLYRDLSHLLGSLVSPTVRSCCVCLDSRVFRCFLHWSIRDKDATSKSLGGVIEGILESGYSTAYSCRRDYYCSMSSTRTWTGTIKLPMILRFLNFKSLCWHWLLGCSRSYFENLYEFAFHYSC